MGQWSGLALSPPISNQAGIELQHGLQLLVLFGRLSLIDTVQLLNDDKA